MVMSPQTSAKSAPANRVRHHDRMSENDVIEEEPRTVPRDLCGRETPVPDGPLPGQDPSIVFCPTCSDELAV